MQQQIATNLHVGLAELLGQATEVAVPADVALRERRLLFGITTRDQDPGPLLHVSRVLGIGHTLKERMVVELLEASLQPLDMTLACNNLYGGRHVDTGVPNIGFAALATRQIQTIVCAIGPLIERHLFGVNRRDFVNYQRRVQAG